MSRRFWVSTISLDHLKLAIEGGYTQANHGHRSGVGDLENSDILLFYCPREMRARQAPRVAKFLAVGTVMDAKPYQEHISPEWKPFRRRVKYQPDVKSVNVNNEKVIAKLDFITEKKKWSYYFRRSLFRIPPKDGWWLLERMGVAKYLLE